MFLIFPYLHRFLEAEFLTFANFIQDVFSASHPVA
jgi:hypothetical protein